MPYPQQKTTYVKPICNRNEDRNFYKVVAERHVQPLPYVTTHQDEDLHRQKENNISFEDFTEVREKGIKAFHSLHSTLFSKVEKIQKWKALVEVDTKQKNKKIEELNQLIDSFRKVKVDLQMQNENLSLQLSNEMQQRNLVSQQLHSARALCLALKKQHDAVQVHIQYRNTIEEDFKATNSKTLKAIEDVKIKFRNLCNENADKISYLNSALASEINKSMTLKETLEQTITEAASKEESLCEILRVRKNEIKNLVNDNDDKNIKLQKLTHDIDELREKILELEKLNEFRLQKMNEMEHKLRITENSKVDFETQYLQEKAKVQDLEEKCKELEEFGNNIKVQSDNYVTDLKKINVELESSVEDLKEKFEEKMKESESLTLMLGEKEEEITRLENKISEVTSGKFKLEEQFMSNIQAMQSRLDEVLTEKNGLYLQMDTVSEKLREAESENKELQNLLFEENEKLSKLEKACEAKELEVKEKHLLEKELAGLLKKTKELEQELSMKTDELKIQQENVSKLQTVLTEKESAFVSLEYENVELKDYISSEKNSIKICLECDSLKNEVNKEINELKQALVKKEEELSIHKCSAVETLKMLGEAEKNYNADWMSKEKEITQCKDHIRSLEEELKITKAKASTAEQVTLENAKMKAEFEDLLKQKVSTVEQVTLENAKLKAELEVLLKQKVSTDEKVKLENAKLKAELEDLLKQKVSTVEQVTLENAKLKAELEDLLKQKNERLEKHRSENTSSDEEVKIISEKITTAIPKKVQSKTIQKSKAPQIKAKAVANIIENQTSCKSIEPQTKANIIQNPATRKSIEPQKKAKAAPTLIQNQATIKLISPQTEAKKVPNIIQKQTTLKSTKPQHTPSLQREKKRKWECYSSDSDSVELSSFQEIASQGKYGPKIFMPLRKIKTPNLQLSTNALSTPTRNTVPKKDILTIEKVDVTPSVSATPESRKFFTTPLSAKNSSSKNFRKFWF